MNKSEFVKHVANQHNITQDEANKVIDTFTSSVISALGEGKEIRLCCMNRHFDALPLSPKSRFMRYA